MSLRIRAAREDDVPALADLAARTWLDAFGESVTPEAAAADVEAKRSEHRFRAALHERTILVAEQDGALVGYAELGDDWLHRLYVETALQGRGIGSALLEAALAHPRLAGAPRVFLQVWEENPGAIRLYERFGFRRHDTTEFELGGEVVEDLVLVLER